MSCSCLDADSLVESCLPLTLLSGATAGAGVRSSCLASLSRLRLLSPLGASEINAARAGLITGSMFALAPTLGEDLESCCWLGSMLFDCI